MFAIGDCAHKGAIVPQLRVGIVAVFTCPERVITPIASVGVRWIPVVVLTLAQHLFSNIFVELSTFIPVEIESFAGHGIVPVPPVHHMNMFLGKGSAKGLGELAGK